jgi:hypothetical protein
MIKLRGKIEYDSGQLVEFETGSAAIAEWELYALRHGYPVGTQAPPMLSMLVVAHYALGIAEGFDVWRKSVSGVELDTEALPPTLTAPTVVARSS